MRTDHNSAAGAQQGAVTPPRPIGAVEAGPLWRQPGKAAWLGLALAVFVLLWQLGARGLSEPDEGRYAAVGRAMADSGDWLVPRLNGGAHFSKPPLTYWLMAGSIRLLGPTEFAARLPAALAGVATLVAVFLMAHRLADERTGFWCGLVLLSSALFLVVCHLASTDMLLTCWISWSGWAFVRWATSADKSFRQAVWLYVFLALGLLTKGPVAVAIPLLGILAARWGHPEVPLRKMGWGRGGLLFVALAAPWFVIVAWRQPDLWNYFLVREVVGRVATNVHKRAQPFWYFVPVLAAGFLPWTFWLLAAVRSRGGAVADLLHRYCLGWAGLGFLLFTLSRSKLATYMMPLLPPLSLLVGRWVAQASPNRRKAAAWTATAVLGLGLAGAALFPVFEKQRGIIPAKYMASEIRRVDPAGQALVVGCHGFQRGLEFYLGHPIYYLHDDQDRFAYEGGHVSQWAWSPAELNRRIGSDWLLVVVRTQHMASVQALPGTWVQVGTDGYWVLLSNRASSTETSRAPRP